MCSLCLILVFAHFLFQGSHSDDPRTSTQREDYQLKVVPIQSGEYDSVTELDSSGSFLCLTCTPIHPTGELITDEPRSTSFDAQVRAYIRANRTANVL